MSATRSVYLCQQCGASSPKWAGQCPSCEAWNTLVETVAVRPAPSVASAARSRMQAAAAGAAAIAPIGAVSTLRPTAWRAASVSWIACWAEAWCPARSSSSAETRGSARARCCSSSPLGCPPPATPPSMSPERNRPHRYAAAPNGWAPWWTAWDWWPPPTWPPRSVPSTPHRRSWPWSTRCRPS